MQNGTNLQAPHRWFPALGLAMDALKEGKGLTNVLNAANEVAVSAFLNKRLDFYGISSLVAEALETALRDGTAREACTVADALAVHHVTRDRVSALLASRHI